MDLEKPKKRRAYGRAHVPKPNKSARMDFHPLGRFSSVPAVKLSGIIRSEKQLFSPRGPSAWTDGDPLGRMDFPDFALFLVLDLVF